MTNREIYQFALHILAQHQISEDTADFEERAPYLLAACCTESKELDTALRKSLGQVVVSTITGVYMDLDDTFPLLQSFAILSGFYLAAMLILDENSELSDKLYDHYCDGMASIQAQIDKRLAEQEKANAEKEEEETEDTEQPEETVPWTLESIGETYFAD